MVSDPAYRSAAYRAEFEVIERPRPSRRGTPLVERRWVEECRRWVAWKQSQGKFQGRNGYEAQRFLRKCGEWLSVAPSRVREADVRSVLGHIRGRAPRTYRFYLSILSSFLSSLGNEVVRHSGIKSAYPNRSVRTPVLPGAMRDAILDRAQGQERVILALLASGRRPVEVRRALVSDLDLTAGDMAVRGKGGRGDVVARVALNETVLRELAWYLPLRGRWSEDAERDSGHLICRSEPGRLVGVSIQYLRRSLAHACERAGTAPWPLYSFRRGAATMLRDRGAEWEDIRDALTHRCIGTTEGYVRSLYATLRQPAVVRLLDAREAT